MQSATNIIAEGSEEELFKNLDAEQARHSYTNQRMADMVGISRVSYENKKKNGKFTALEAKKMCKIFKVKFGIRVIHGYIKMQIAGTVTKEQHWI